MRDQRLLSLKEAVRKMTGGSAAALGLGDLLRPGMWADVVVFDPARVRDVATYDNPHQYASGVETVLVNEQVVVDGGDHSGAMPGQMLRHVRP